MLCSFPSAPHSSVHIPWEIGKQLIPAMLQHRTDLRGRARESYRGKGAAGCTGINQRAEPTKKCAM